MLLIVLLRTLWRLSYQDMYDRLHDWPTLALACGLQAVALTYTATIIIALAAQQAGRPDLIRSPKRVLAHTWEGF